MTVENDAPKSFKDSLTYWLTYLVYGQRPTENDEDDQDSDSEPGEFQPTPQFWRCPSPVDTPPLRRSLSPESFIDAPKANGRSRAERRDWTRSSATLVDMEPLTKSESLRRRERRLIQLTSSGHLVVNCPVPQRLHQAIDQKTGEFSTMRYTAVCCAPDDFSSSGYTLRQQIKGRTTELFIVITLYNEDEVAFARTLHGVMKNIAHLCGRKRWGPQGWKKVVVSIVADGRQMINRRVLSILASMGVYQSGIAKSKVDDQPVEAHIYEYTTQISVDSDMRVKGSDKGIVPVQILLCIKERNLKKINSHRWFFNAFGSVLNPNICVLLDVGTRPANVSIYKLWKTFQKHPHVGGACGEIRAMLGTACLGLANPLVASQNFEYKMSNILDKPLETTLGYISVLPGAFSAYRYSALQSNVNGQGPLEKYFRGEHLTTKAGVFERNMYLAEDRILCFELVAKPNQQWLLHYVKNAFAETDVPDTISEFISQRRRWLNGSFFASVYALFHIRSLWASEHSWTRLFLFTIQAVYNLVTLLFNWLALANFYIVFYYICKSLAAPEVDPFGNGWGGRLFDVFNTLYLFLIIICVICSMGNRPQGAKPLFMACFAGFAVIMAYMLFATSWLTYKACTLAVDRIQWTNNQSINVALAFQDETLRNMIISLLATYGLYFVSSLLYLQPWHMVTSFLPYLFLLPAYINILNIYAFCNTHDVSWGTKGDTATNEHLGVATKVTSKGPDTVEVELPADQLDINLDYEEALDDLDRPQAAPTEPPPRRIDDADRSFRTYLVLAWIMCNALLAVIITAAPFDSIFLPATGTTYLTIILWTNAGLALFRFIGSFVYLILRLFSAA